MPHDAAPPEIFRIGSAPRRVEDLRFLRGKGRFVDDVECPTAAHMVLVRSPHAAAHIRTIEATRARAAPGVLAVLTADDLEDVGTLRTAVARSRADGSPMIAPPYPMLAHKQVRFVGDAVAAVIAETYWAARDAADLVDVAYDPIASVTDIVDATAAGAPSVWPQEAPDNRAFHFEAGDRAAVDVAFRSADHVVTLDFRISRVSARAARSAAWPQ